MPAELILRAMDAAHGRDRLTVLAYHRIVEMTDEFPYAPEVVSASPENFGRQLDWVARNFSVIAADDLERFLIEGHPLPARPLLITFDDGYADNAEIAFPALRARGLPGVMFLISRLVGRRELTYWDECASLLRRTRLARAVLPMVGAVELIDRATRSQARSALIEWLKRLPPAPREQALAELRERLEVEVERPPAPLFFGWERVPELVAGGVSCQPHTASHPILSALAENQQREEVEESARAVEAHTGRAALALSYPNGEAADYDDRTVRILREARLRLGFTMRPGAISPKTLRDHPFDVPRIGVRHADSFGAFTLKVAGLAGPARRARALARAARQATRPS